MTPLDAAFQVSETAPDDDAARLQFFGLFASTELFVLLASDAKGDQIEPRLFPVEDGTFVLAFDREERLADFTGQPAPYASLSGRRLVDLLLGQDIGVGLNLDVAASSTLIPAAALEWLARTLGNGPELVQGVPTEIAPPGNLPERLITALDENLSLATGLARHAYLCGVTFDTGVRTHIVAFIDADPNAQDALSRLISKALVFSGIEAGSLDVAFFAADDPFTEKLTQTGLRFDLPQPQAKAPRIAPGADPDHPPKLR